MLSTFLGRRTCRSQPTLWERRPYPARTLHLIDVENLTGCALPSRSQVCEVRTSYARRVGLGPADQVVAACSHRSLVDMALGWPSARYKIRSGPDGADLALLEVVDHEHVAVRFSEVVIGSGDGIFAAAAAGLAAAGCRVTAVSRRESLSAQLRLAVCKVIYIDTTGTASAARLPYPPQAA